MRPWLPRRCWSESDGLSWVPDLWYYKAGKRHDWRYRKLGNFEGLNTGQSRAIYDLAFLFDMANLDREIGEWLMSLFCDIEPFIKLGGWSFWALAAPIRRTYYYGVRLFGWKAYQPYPVKVTDRRHT